MIQLCRHAKKSAVYGTVLYSLLNTCPAAADSSTLILPEPNQLESYPQTEQQTNRERLKENIRNLTRTQISEETDLAVQHDGAIIRRHFSHSDIKTELEAKTNGEVIFRIRMPF